MFVYVIKNDENGKIYIGKTITADLNLYLKRKVRDALKGTYRGRSRLFAAMRKYQSRVWSIHPLISCLVSNWQLCLWEKALIYAFDSINDKIGYNICRGGEGRTGPQTLEARAKMSENQKQRCTNPEWRAHLAKNFGNIWDDPQYRAKQSEDGKKRWSNPVFHAKGSKINKEIWNDPQHRVKMSEISKGLWTTPEYRAIQSASSNSLEGRARRSEARKKVWADPERRLRCSESNKERWNAELRLEKSIAAKKLWNDRGYRLKCIKGFAKRKARNPEPVALVA